MLQIHPSNSWEKAIQGGRACTLRQSARWGTERWTSRLTRDTVCSQSWEMGWWTDMRCGAKRAINEKTDILHLSRRKTGALLQKCGDCRKSKLGGGGVTSLFFYTLTLRCQLDPTWRKQAGSPDTQGVRIKTMVQAMCPDEIIFCLVQSRPIF